MNLIKRYTNSKMEKIWSDENKFAKFLEVELASTEAFAKLGIIQRSGTMPVLMWRRLTN